MDEVVADDVWFGLLCSRGCVFVCRLMSGCLILMIVHSIIVGCLVVSVVWFCCFCRLFFSTCLDVRHFSLDVFVSFMCV